MAAVSLFQDGQDDMDVCAVSQEQVHVACKGLKGSNQCSGTSLKRHAEAVAEPLTHKAPCSGQVQRLSVRNVVLDGGHTAEDCQYRHNYIILSIYI